MRPAVSIIIPVYRPPMELLGTCLDSVLGQTLHVIELIAVNDASPDASPQRLDEFARRDPRMTVLHRTINGSAAAARNDGLARASGDYVLFADADDELEPGICENLLTLAERHEADLVVCSFSIHDARKRQVGHGYLPNRFYDLTVPNQRLRAARQVRSVLWNKLFRRDRISDLRFEQFPVQFGEDAVFAMAGFSRSRSMVTTSYSGYRYRISPNSASRRASKGLPYLQTSMAAHDKMMQALNQNGAGDVAAYYGGAWALGRYALGCLWIDNEPDPCTKQSMWTYWAGILYEDVAPQLPCPRAMRLGYRLLLSTGNLKLIYRFTRVVLTVLRLRGGAVRDELEARFFSRQANVRSSQAAESVGCLSSIP